MLYHVPHRLAALHELRRVVRSGGRVVLATNGSNYLACLAGLHQEAALALGYTPSDGDGNRFTLDDLKLVQQVFPFAEAIRAQQRAGRSRTRANRALLRLGNGRPTRRRTVRWQPPPPADRAAE